MVGILNRVKVASPKPSARPFSRKPQRSFGYLLRETSRRLDRAISRSLTEYNLTVSQYHLLRELWETEGLTVRELATRVNVAEPSTLLTLTKMQSGNLVVMRTDAKDRRKRCVFLEPAGKALRVPVLDAIAHVGTRAYDDISLADLQIAANVFAAIEKNLDE